MTIWNSRAKRLLKSELIKRGISNAELVILLNDIDIKETKSGIDNKISRGTFSATFFIQCLTVIGCNKFELHEFHTPQLSAVAETKGTYLVKKI